MLVTIGSQSAASNAAAVVIGRRPSTEYLIQICAEAVIFDRNNHVMW